MQILQYVVTKMLILKFGVIFISEKGSVRVLGEMKLALKGQSVEFECQAAGWYPQPTLQWQLNGRKVSTWL